MSDMINRQAVLDALGERPVVWSDNDDYTLGERNQYDMDRLAIETVPSAQPECEDAVSREAVLDEIHRYMEERDYTIGLLDDNVCGLPSVTPKQPGWIPTSVRLPEEKTAVLITTTKGCVIQCMYWGYQNGHHTWRSLGNQYLYWEMDVVAWMPLPKPYREGKKNE